MLDYIKKEIARRTADKTASAPVDDDTALVLEYSHIFQELDDLSIEGSEENKMRPLDIPLDDEGQLDDDDFDDIEIEEIGYNVATGTLNVASDASIKAEYALMKTHDDFIEESFNLIQQEHESDVDYTARRIQFAEDNFMKYRQEILQEGMFGYDRIKVDSDRVPNFASINFGKDRGSDYHVRFEIQHQVDNSGNITRKQLESIHIAEACSMCESLMDQVTNDLRERYHISESANIWDNIVPSIFVAPIDPIDKHAVIVGFKNGANLSSMDFYRFTNPVKEYSTGETVLEYAEVERIDPSRVRELSKYCMTKNAAIKESRKENPRYHRVFQEAINVGGDNTGDSDNSNNNVQSTDQNAAPPTDNNNADNTTSEADNKATVEVSTNDVSDQIADSVASENKNQTPDDASVGQDAVTDIPENEVPDTPDDTNVDDSNNATDGVSVDNMSLDNVDDQLADLNASGNEDAALSDGDLGSDEIDIDNMSMDDLIKSGTERLKSMSLSQLKEFLANNDSAAVQEAFILTKANINDEVDIYLKKVLGVLNDSKLEINELVSEFKKYGKKLNKILTKASKVTAIYNNNEIDNIKKLNKCLADLLVTIKASTDKSSISVIKRLIKAFTSQAAVVGKIVEKKKKTLPKAEKKETKKVQESYISTSIFGSFLND